MIFERWQFLLGLVTVPMAAGAGWWAFRRAERTLSSLSSTRRMSRAPVIAALFLEAAGMGLLIVALAGPERTPSPDEAAREPLDVVVCVDVSLSMRAEDVAPDRLGRAMRAVGVLVDHLETRSGRAASAGTRNTRLGLVEFAGSARVISPLTDDFRIIDESLEMLGARFRGKQGSDLVSGLDASLGLFGVRRAARNVILVTDGEHRSGSASLVTATFGGVVDRARSDRVFISSLIVGTPEGARIPGTGGVEFVTDSSGREVLTRSRTDRIEPIVEACGGTIVTSADRAFAMDALYETLINRLGEDAHASATGSDRSLFQWFLLAGILCVLAGLFLNRCVSLGRAARVPLAAAALVLGSCGGGEGVDLVRDGLRSFRADDLAAAGASFEKALVLGPENAGIRLNLGLVRYRQGRFGDAAELFEAAARSADQNLSLPARFGLGLCDYRNALGLLEKEDHDVARLENAARSAERGSEIFEVLALEGFRRPDSLHNCRILADLAVRIGKKLAELEATHDNDRTADRSTGVAGGDDGSRAAAGAESGESTTGTPRTDFKHRARAAGWADDPGPLSPREIDRIFARLDEIKRARQDREAESERETLSGEVDW